MATNEQVIAWLTANPTATDAQITAVANLTGVTPQQLAAVTGLNVSDVVSRMTATGGYTAPPPPTPPVTKQGYGEAATQQGGLNDFYKSALPADQYNKLIEPLLRTANEFYGGKVQDYQVQLLTPLDTSKIAAPKQLEFQADGNLKTPNVTGDAENGYTTATPELINGIPVYTNYDASGKVTGYTGDDRVTSWTSEKDRFFGNWKADGSAAPATTSSTGGGLLGTGISWVDLRDNLEAAASIAGNYFLPGSSLVTSQLVTKGAQENLNTDAGRLANLAAGAAGGLAGNMSNYGAIGEAAGLTGPAATGAEVAGTSTAGAASGSVSSDVLAAANATSDPLATLNALKGYTYADLDYLSSLAGMTPQILATAAANNALLTPIPTEVIPSGSSTVTPVTATPPATSLLPGSITASQVIKALPLVPVVNQLIGDPLGLTPKPPTPTAGVTGFDQVPIPTDWRSPTYQTNQAPIDLNSIFSTQNMLGGTQWQGLPNQRNVSFNDIFAAGQQQTPMGTPVNINQIVSSILGQNPVS